MNKHEGGEAASPTKLEYQKQLSAAMKVPDDLKVLSFKENKPKPAEGKVYTWRHLHIYVNVYVSTSFLF